MIINKQYLPERVRTTRGGSIHNHAQSLQLNRFSLALIAGKIGIRGESVESWTKRNFLYYESIEQRQGKPMPVDAFLRDLQSEKGGSIENLRDWLKNDEASYADQKKKLPCVMPSLSVHKDNSSYTGIVCLDFDDVPDPEAKKAEIQLDPYVALCFVSPSGRGLKIWILSDLGVERHKEVYLSALAYFERTYELTGDPKCTNVNRLCFISYDPSYIIAENPQAWTEPLVKIYLGKDNPLLDSVSTCDPKDADDCRQSNNSEALAKLMMDADEFDIWHGLNASPISYRDLAKKDISPPQVLVEGMLHKGEKMLLTGPSKGMKSWTLLSLAYSIATGREWLGMPTSKSKVLYVNYELEEYWLRSRVDKIHQKHLELVMKSSRRILNHNQNEKPENLIHLNLRGVETKFEDLVARMIKYCEIQEIAFIVLDPFYKASPGLDELSTEQIGWFLNQVDFLSRESGAAVAISHHHTKGSSAHKEVIDLGSGTGVFGRDPDVLVAIRPSQANTKSNESNQDNSITDAKAMGANIDFVFRNLPPRDTIIARWDPPFWVQDGNIQLMNDSTKSKQAFTVEQIMKTLARNELTVNDWSDRCQQQWKMADRTFRDLKKHAEEQGLLDVKQYGKEKICRAITPTVNANRNLAEKHPVFQSDTSNAERGSWS